MPFITYTSGLTIKSPTRGTKNYEETLRTDTWQKISEHDHTAGGKGNQLGTGALVDDAVTDAKLRLRNNFYLRARNAASNADVDTIKLNTNDHLQIAPHLHSARTVALSNNISSFTNTGISVSNSYARSFKVEYAIYRDATTDITQIGEIFLRWDGASWHSSHEFINDAGILFSVTAGGALQYTSTNLAGHTSSNMYFLSVSTGV
jgi:hypothetical protein